MRFDVLKELLDVIFSVQWILPNYSIIFAHVLPFQN